MSHYFHYNIISPLFNIKKYLCSPWDDAVNRYPIVSYGNEAHDNKDIFNQSSDATRPGDSLEGEDVAFPVLKFNKEVSRPCIYMYILI